MKKSYKMACVGFPPVGRTTERLSFVFAHRAKLSSVLICCLLLLTCAHYVVCHANANSGHCDAKLSEGCTRSLWNYSPPDPSHIFLH